MISIPQTGTNHDTPGAEVEWAAHARLRASGYAALRDLACEFHDGVLVIRGQVSSFHLKQMAQTLVRSIAQVQRIDNRVRVDK